jgi:purine-binding chemotaxis protein CheW
MSNYNEASKNRYLCFTLGLEEYAVPLTCVKEVIALPEVTPVPQTAVYFKGIMNLRGQVISIIDLRVKLGIKAIIKDENVVIICDLQGSSIGVIVDSVNRVIHPEEKDISSKPEVQGQKNVDYLMGVVRKDQQLILLIDLAKSLSFADQQTILNQTTNPKKAA